MFTLPTTDQLNYVIRLNFSYEYDEHKDELIRLIFKLLNELQMQDDSSQLTLTNGRIIYKILEHLEIMAKSYANNGNFELVAIIYEEFVCAFEQIIEQITNDEFVKQYGFVQ